MTGEQKPGGLEVVQWEYRTANHRQWHITDSRAVAEQERLDGSEVIPRLVRASSAEARIRELEAECDASMREIATLREEADAAEAKLTKAKEALERIRDHVESAGDAPPDDVMRDIAQQTLAALQQEGE